MRMKIKASSIFYFIEHFFITCFTCLMDTNREKVAKIGRGRGDNAQLGKMNMGDIVQKSNSCQVGKR